MPEDMHDWQARVQEVERQLDALATGLDGVRSAVRDLSSRLETAETAVAEPVAAAVSSIEPAFGQPAAREPVALDAIFGAPLTTEPAAVAEAAPEPPVETSAPEPAFVPLPTAAEPAQIEVSTAQPAVEAEPAPVQKYTSGFGWNVERPWPGPASTPSTMSMPSTPEQRPQASDAAASDWAQQARGWGNHSFESTPAVSPEPAAAEPPANSAAPSDEETKREEVRRAVEALRNEVGWQTDDDDAAEAALEEPQAGVEDDEEARREEVRRAVAAMRGETGWPTAADVAPEQPQMASTEDDEEAKREEVRRALASMRGDGAWPSDTEAASPEPQAESEDDEEARREEVRRAVAAMRGEMAGSGAASSHDAGSADDEPVAARPVVTPPAAPSRDWTSQPVTADMLGPPSIVIDDPSGRVDLARVYDTLSRLQCSGDAALLNYTPHSITVGLSSRVTIPTPDALETAVQAVFGRKCTVTVEGSRLAVRISSGSEEAA